MAKITLGDVISGFSLQRINDNFSRIADVLNEQVFFRANPSGEANHVQNTLDMNSNHIVNLPAPSSDNEPARLKDVKTALYGEAAKTATFITFDPTALNPATNVQGAIEAMSQFSPYAGVFRPISSKLLEQVSVLDYGADPTGVTDSSAAFQRVIDAYKNVYVPPGTYLINTPLNVTSDVSIHGEKRKSILKKTSTTTNTVTRTYVDGNGATQTLTWNQPVVFNLICPNNSYLIDFQIDNITFDLPANATAGVFHAQRVAHCSFSNLFCNTSLFFAKGFDMWQIDWRQIRSRFSKEHFTIDTGTSNSFTNVSCDTKYNTGGTGYTFSNLNYTVMNGSSCDGVDRCYYFSNSIVTMNGCGSESFSRLLQAVNGARVTVNGGSLAVYKSASATGTFYPYEISGANTSVSMNNTWLGVANVASPGGTFGQFAVTGGANLVLNNVRKPIGEIGAGTSWYYIADANSLLTLIDEGGIKFINRYGPSRLDGVTNKKCFEYVKKSLTAGSNQSVFRINNSAYGTSCIGKIRLIFINSYADGMGFAGEQEYRFSCMKETTASQAMFKDGETFVPSNANGSPLGLVTGSLVRNADNTVDFQLNVTNAPTVVSNTDVIVMVEYFSFLGTGPANEVITGL